MTVFQSFKQRVAIKRNLNAAVEAVRELGNQIDDPQLGRAAYELVNLRTRILDGWKAEGLGSGV